jgi:hypothetical protein
MADFVAVLKKTIDGLDEANPEVRRKVYDKARTTIAAKLSQINPPPPAAVAERQTKALEDAIRTVEAEYSAAGTRADEPADELEAIFASLSDPKPRAAPKPPEPVAPKPAAPLPAALANRPPEHPAAAMPSALSGVQRPPVAPPKPAPATSAASPERPLRQETDPDSFFLEPDEDTFSGEIVAPAPTRRRGGGLLITLLALIVVAGAAYGAWSKRGDIASALGVQLPKFARTGEPAAKEVAIAKPEPAKNADADQKPAAPPSAEGVASAEGAAKNDKQADAVTTPPAVTKFTQRLAADGTESNPGQAAGEAKIGEGTSVAAATPAENNNTPAGGNASAQPAPGADKAQVPVAQRAIFYEERTNTEQGSANTGTIVWSLVKESPGGDLPPEPAIRGEATIPARNLQLRITIRRNGDKTLPASHIVELIFLTPDNFEGGGIDSVLRMAMKDTEQAPGNPIIGIPAKIADGYFLLALNDGKAEVETNTTLLRRDSWIDIPVVYKSGRRALMTLEKGIPGDKVFDDVLNAWGQTPIGQQDAPAPSGDDGNQDANKPAPASGTSG